MRVEENGFAISFDAPLPSDDLTFLRNKVKQGAGFSPEEKAAIEGWILGVDR